MFFKLQCHTLETSLINEQKHCHCVYNNHNDGHCKSNENLSSRAIITTLSPCQVSHTESLQSIRYEGNVSGVSRRSRSHSSQRQTNTKLNTELSKSQSMFNQVKSTKCAEQRKNKIKENLRRFPGRKLRPTRSCDLNEHARQSSGYCSDIETTLRKVSNVLNHHCDSTDSERNLYGSSESELLQTKNCSSSLHSHTYKCKETNV